MRLNCERCSPYGIGDQNQQHDAVGTAIVPPGAACSQSRYCKQVCMIFKCLTPFSLLSASWQSICCIKGALCL